MGAMTIRNLDPKAAEVLRRRARVEGRSMNDLVVEILCRAAADEERRRRMREQRPGGGAAAARAAAPLRRAHVERKAAA